MATNGKHSTMNWDEDIDLLAGKKSAPKQGRRSSQHDKDTPPEVPVRTKKTGLWTEEAAKSAKVRGPNIIEQERFQGEIKEGDDDDIPIIPDIDDLQDDPLNLPDVKPMVSVEKSTYKELDRNLDALQAEPSFGNLGDIDLSFLTSKLYPEKDVQIPNEIWTMESLFAELSST